MLHRQCVAAVTVLLSVLAVSCGKDKSPTNSGDTPPAIASTFPASDATSVPVTVQPAVTFTKDIDPLSGSGSIVLQKEGVTIPGELSYSGRTVTLIPSSVLDSGADYFVTVKTSVYDKSGLALAAPYTWRFSTSARSSHLYPLVWTQASAGSGAKVMAVDGSGGAGISLVSSGDARWLTWSLNGQKLLWVSLLSGCNELWTMNAEGSGQTKVASGPNPCPASYGHSWSPDATKIAMLTAGTTHDLVVMNADGSNPVVVASNIKQGEWSRDGTRFAVIRDSTLSVMYADGSGVVQTVGGAKAIIGWKAMSDTIVYITARDSVATIRAGGGDQTLWQPCQYFVEREVDNVALTRDGLRVVYQQHYQIHYTNFVTGVRHYVNLPYETRNIDVSSDGQWMAVSSPEGGDADIILISFDGIQAVNMTNSAGVADRMPRFRPMP